MKASRRYIIGAGDPVDPTEPTPDSIILKVQVTGVTSPLVDLADFKFNKNMAFAVGFDDTLIAHATHMMPLFVGGVSGVNGVTYPGLKYSDGTGKMIPFHATMVVPVGAIRDVHGESGAASFSWVHAQQMLNNQFSFNNHTFYHGGSPTNWDKFDDISKGHQKLYDKIGYRPLIGTTPASEIGNLFTFKNLGYWCHNSTFNEGAGDITYYGGFIDPSDFPTEFCNLDRGYFGDSFTTSEANAMRGYIDEIFDASEGGEKMFGNMFTHGPGDIANFNSVYQYLLSKGGSKLWVPSVQELFEYFHVKRQTAISQSLVGSELTIVLDQVDVEKNVRDRTMSLLLSGCTIQSVTVEGANDVTFNASTGLINVYKVDGSKTINPANDITPARLISVVASGNNVVITYDKAVTQSLTQGYGVSSRTVTGLTGSGTNWTLSTNGATAGQTLTYRSNNGNAITPGSANKAVCDYINYPIS